jgi:hypothetical protein
MRPTGMDLSVRHRVRKAPASGRYTLTLTSEAAMRAAFGLREAHRALQILITLSDERRRLAAALGIFPEALLDPRRLRRARHGLFELMAALGASGYTGRYLFPDPGDTNHPDERAVVVDNIPVATHTDPQYNGRTTPDHGPESQRATAPADRRPRTKGATR